MLSLLLALGHASPLVYPMDAVRVVDVDSDGMPDVVVGADGVHYGIPSGFSGIQPLTKRVEADGSVFGDLDGDGATDVCRWEWDHLWCYAMAGRALGTPLLDEAIRVRAAHLVDTDADGDLDLFVTTDEVELFRNDGSGGLVAEPWLADITTAFLDADVDGDGLVDLVTWVPNGRELYWSRRTAKGLELPEVLLDGISASFAYGFADALGDAVPDMISQSYGFPVYLREAGVGGAPSPDSLDTGWITTGPLGYGAPEAMVHRGRFVLADLDGLGAPGLVVTDDDMLWWDAPIDGSQVALRTLSPRSLGSGVQGASVPYAVAGDADGDGAPDLLVSDVDLTVVLDPRGAAAEHTLQHGTDTVGPVAVGDIDVDGYVDLLYADATSGAAWVLPGRGAGQFGTAVPAQAVGPATQLRLADVTGDGVPELVGVASSGAVGLRKGDPTGVFEPSLGHTDGVRQPRGEVVDLDGDGLDEVVLARIGGGLLWADDDGAGQPQWTAWPGAELVQSLAAGDLEGDGQLELVVLTTNDEVVIYATGAKGLAEVDRVGAPGREPFAVYLADRDGDGADELLVHSDCELGYVYGVYPYCQTRQLLHTASGAPGALSAFVLTGEIDAPVRVGPWLEPTADALIGVDGVVLAAFDGAHQPTMLDERTLLEGLELADLDGDGDLDAVLVDALGVRAVWGGPPGDGTVVGTIDSGDTGLDTGPHTGLDTGVDTAPDTAPDTGSVPGTTGDTAAPIDTDAPVPVDTAATATTDTGTAASTPASDEASTSCGCQSTRGAGLAWLVALLGLGRRRSLRP